MNAPANLRVHWSATYEPQAAAISSSTARPAPASTAYTASSGMTQELAAFWPAMTSGDSATLPNQRIALDRTRHLVRNDPHATAAIMRLVDMVVGAGWQCVPTPDARALGIDPKTAREIGRVIRSEWKLFSRDPRKFADARRRLSLNGLLRLAARTFAIGGEATSAIKYDRRRVEKLGARYATCVAQIDPDRVCNPKNAADSLKIRGGVEFDRDGVPVAYHVRNGHIADWWASVQAQTWTRIERETSWGRPVFIHAFEPEREDQTRAVTPFAALVSRLRMIGKHGDTELANATANALLAAFVYSDLPDEEVASRLAAGGKESSVRASYMTRALDYLEKNPAVLGGVRIPIMPPGHKISLNNAPRPTTAFHAFQSAFLQSIAAALGLSYEQLSMDWSRTNYSSARAALNEVWRAIKRLQAVFAEQYVQPIYLAFLEEAFDKGYVVAPEGAPDFWGMPEAYASVRWIGPGRGYVDPVKEAEGAALRMEGLTSNLETECADQSIDWEENIEQIAFENDVLKENGLSRMSIVAAVQANKGVKPDSEEATGPAGAGEQT
ncbi:phage portal protein [Rhodoblastus acidophilus]|uniref:Phage portal protein n=1 Tax=Rhodoblastus acidophilus TaxID=1074 RepID=A0A6N8DV22_RHOAC|nr:phage portal protein [Rhodoblastus acidophilus]MCW2276368.1 lambda family phage portal protein [Rhodoblastus acidophilus]MTV33023.1 phage portal protein [Rhodoblastus acidophilus]